MFEDNEYLKKVREQFGMTDNVDVKINKMLGKDKVVVKED